MKNQHAISGIYYIENIVNGKKYIGSSHNIFKRLTTHVNKLKVGKHFNKHLQAAFNKYELKSFRFSITEKCNIELLAQIEQLHIDKHEWNTLYNKANIAYSGGSNVVEKQLHLIDLKGNIVETFNSGAELARYLSISIANYSTINTSAIVKTQYRVVTPEYYQYNYELILLWKPYSNLTLHKKQLNASKPIKYKVFKENERHLFNTLTEVGTFLKISNERVRQLLNKVHQETGYVIVLNN